MTTMTDSRAVEVLAAMREDGGVVADADYTAAIDRAVARLREPVGVGGLVAKWRRQVDGNSSDRANAISRCADELEAIASAPQPPAEAQVPSYDALLIIAQSVCGALERAGITDCDDPGEAIDVLRERYESQAQGGGEVAACQMSRRPIAWIVQTEHHGECYQFSDEFVERFPGAPADLTPFTPAPPSALVGAAEAQAQGGGDVCAHHWCDYGQMNVSWCRKCEAKAVTGYEDRPFTAPTSAPVKVEAIIEAFDEITGLCRHLRQGGPDPEDLQGLSDALEEAIGIAGNMLAALAQQPAAEAVRDALSWLRAALDCPTFSWDADQRDAAEAALAAALAAQPGDSDND